MEQVDKLLKRYKEGATSLEEESYLRNSCPDQDGNYKWFGFLRAQRRDTPVDLEDKVLEAIDSDMLHKRRIIYRISSTAAILIILLTSVFIKPWQSKEMDYIDKLAVLVEARNMFPVIENEQADKEVIYEDETIIIYIK